MNERADFPLLDDVFMRNEIFNPGDMTDLSFRIRTLLDKVDARRFQIENALAYSPGTHTYDQIVGMILQGQLTYWHLPGSFMLTEVHVFPNARHYHIFLAGGELEELVEMHPDVIEVAKALHCDKLTLSGRPGWARALKPHGWEPYLVTLAKDI